jgi:putative flippase GtrA
MLRKLESFIDRKSLSQFLSYLIVGGSATAVEWVLFWWFVYPLGWNQNFGFTVAYIISTFVNMILGRLLTFRNASIVHKSDNPIVNLFKETAMIYFVAAIGCVLNLLLLNFFSDIFHMNSMMAKVLATGIMLIGNFLARKLGIYRNTDKAMDQPSLKE